jgi:WD40 repeat protein
MAGCLLAAVAGLVGGLVLAGRPALKPQAPMPSRVVVWTAGSKIEVLSSRTGRLIRTLVTGVALTRGTPSMAVSPAGVVYFDSARGFRDYLFSVPLAGGPVTTVAAGWDPAISPDGQLLAYLTSAYSDPSLPGAEAIIVWDVRTGLRRSWAFSSYDRDISSLSWSPDGRYLAYAGDTYAGNGTVAVQTAQMLDARAPLYVARIIPLRKLAWAGFLTRHAGLAVRVDAYGAIEARAGVLAVSVPSGRVIGRLTSLPSSGLAISNTFDGTENTITADRSGRYLLIAGVGSGTGEIFRWTFGMPHPVVLTTGALTAAWAS